MTFEILTYVDYIGTLVFAISGVLAGVEKKFDLFGVFTLGLVTAIGGGTLRDILIGQTPVSWMNNIVYIFLCISALPICYLFQSIIIRWKKSFFIFDTIGIATFTILGVEKTTGIGLSPIIAVMMGVVSAVFGGVIRDTLSNQIPLIFRKEIYALACLAGAVIYLILSNFLNQPLSAVLSILAIILIRVFSIKFKWHLGFNPLNLKSK